MEILTSVDGSKATVALGGKLTVQTAPDLEAAIGALGDEVSDIDLDLAKVSYVSSAGLRVFLATSKLAIRRGGELRLLNPVEEIMDILEVTGFSEILTIVR